MRAGFDWNGWLPSVERDAIQLAAGERQHVRCHRTRPNEILSAGHDATTIGGNLGRHGTKTIAGGVPCLAQKMIPRVTAGWK